MTLKQSREVNLWTKFELCFVLGSNFKYWSVKSLPDDILQNPFNQSPAYQLDEHKKHVIKYKSTLADLVRTESSFSVHDFYCHSNHGFKVASHHNHNHTDLRALLPVVVSPLHATCLIEENLQPSDKFWLSHQILVSHMLSPRSRDG